MSQISWGTKNQFWVRFDRMQNSSEGADAAKGFSSLCNMSVTMKIYVVFLFIWAKINANFRNEVFVFSQMQLKMFFGRFFSENVQFSNWCQLNTHVEWYLIFNTNSSSYVGKYITTWRIWHLIMHKNVLRHENSDISYTMKHLLEFITSVATKLHFQ